MVLKLSNLPRKDVLAHVVTKKPGNFFDDEIDIYFDGILPGGDVTQDYVDTADANTLAEAKSYTDSEIEKISTGITTKLYTGFGQNIDGAVTQKFFTDTVNSVTDNVGDVTDAMSTLQSDITDLQSDKQDTLVSGTNIKTINGQPIMGSGDLEVTAEPETLTANEFNLLWENA